MKPEIKKDNLITPAGYDRMYSELRKLADEDRPKLLEEIAAAAAQGDRSENAEYIYGRKRLREVDKRINFLKSRLERAKIIDPATQKKDRVDFGASVVIEDEDGIQKKWVIIGEDEAEPSKGHISWKSPIGRAMLNKHSGDFFEVETPKGPKEFSLISFEFVPIA